MSETSSRAYAEIRRRIQCGALQPGDRLVERTLCAELDMSRTPVREALSRLTAEGLATRRPHRGMVVAELSQAEIEEIFEVGLLIESYMTALAARKMDHKTLKVLGLIVEDMRSALHERNQDTSRYVDLDHRFHQTIADTAGNSRLATMLRAAMDARVLYQAFRQYSPDQLRQSLTQHETILTALRAGDADWAASAMRNHILTGRATSREEGASAERGAGLSMVKAS